jgi:hypothetical protein
MTPARRKNYVLYRLGMDLLLDFYMYKTRL